jgi:hypothetical protein
MTSAEAVPAYARGPSGRGDGQDQRQRGGGGECRSPLNDELAHDEVLAVSLPRLGMFDGSRRIPDCPHCCAKHPPDGTSARRRSVSIAGAGKRGAEEETTMNDDSDSATFFSADGDIAPVRILDG